MRGEGEKEETETDRRQEDVPGSNKRLNGGAGKLRLEDAFVKLCQWDW